MGDNRGAPATFLRAPLPCSAGCWDRFQKSTSVGQAGRPCHPHGANLGTSNHPPPHETSDRATRGDFSPHLLPDKIPPGRLVRQVLRLTSAGPCLGETVDRYRIPLDIQSTFFTGHAVKGNHLLRLKACLKDVACACGELRGELQFYRQYSKARDVPLLHLNSAISRRH